MNWYYEERDRHLHFCLLFHYTSGATITHLMKLLSLKILSSLHCRMSQKLLWQCWRCVGRLGGWQHRECQAPVSHFSLSLVIAPVKYSHPQLLQPGQTHPLTHIKSVSTAHLVWLYRPKAEVSCRGRLSLYIYISPLPLGSCFFFLFYLVCKCVDYC